MTTEENIQTNIELQTNEHSDTDRIIDEVTEDIEISHDPHHEEQGSGNNETKPNETNESGNNDTTSGGETVSKDPIVSESNVQEDHKKSAHHDPAVEIQNEKPWRLHVWMADHPCLSYTAFLSAFIINIVMIIILSTNGTLIRFTTDVPMYMRADLRQEQYDTLLAGEDDADYERGGSSTLQQSSQSDESLQLVFKAKSSTLIKTKTLEAIREIEEEIFQIDTYPDYCQIQYDADNNAINCTRYESITHFYDPDYFKGALNQTYDQVATERNYDAFLAPSLVLDASLRSNPDFSADNINKTTTFWAEYNRDQTTYNGRTLPVLFQYSLPDDGSLTNSSLANLFSFLADNDFAESPVDTDVKAALTAFYFGLPLDGYDSAAFDLSDQNDEISEWCYDELNDKLFKWRRQNDNRFDLTWSCGDMLNYYIDAIIGEDLIFLFGTIIIIWAYMVFAMGSVWLANMGMLMIFLNFAPSLILYRYITQIKYFGTLNMLCLFIILSIGADDIFVLNDTWAQVRQEAPNADRAKRLTHTLKHAAKVMATTSLSTIVSFLGNVSSVFPGIYTFGAFAAWLVFVNYCAVVLFFPAAIILHDEYFFTPNLKYGCCMTKYFYKMRLSICACCFRDSNLKSDEDLKREATEKRAIDAFFEKKYFKYFIWRFRKIILSIFLAIFLIFFFFASQLVPDPNPPQFFPDSDPYQKFSDVLTDNFASDSSFQLTAKIVIGLKGIDRSGTDETLPDQIGDPKYSKNITFETYNQQLWLAQFCDDLLCQYEDYDCRYANDIDKLEISDPDAKGGDLVVKKCFVSELRTWMLTDPDAQPNKTEIKNIYFNSNFSECGYNVSEFLDCEWGQFPQPDEICMQFLWLFIWLDDSLPTTNPDYTSSATNYDYWRDFMYARDAEDLCDVTLSFFEISVLLDSEITSDFQDGIKLWKDWDTYISNWKTNEPGDVSQDQYGNDFVEMPTKYKDIFFTDSGGGFAYFYVQEQVITECLTGIGISLILALFILIIATNNWVLAIMSTFIIFQIVICVIGFAVMLGWKLGAIESVIFIMVVGMSVDYVVHLSEAYLHVNAQRRKKRAKKMLGRIGASILSGFASTFLGIIFLTPAYILFFYKFGLCIAFLEICSVSFGLIAFAAAVASFGPEYDIGNVRKDALILKACCQNICKPSENVAEEESDSDDDE